MENTEPTGTTCVVGGCTDPNCDGLHHTGEAGQRWSESEATYRAALEKRKRDPWY
jgi:hypothetical protein